MGSSKGVIRGDASDRSEQEKTNQEAGIAKSRVDEKEKYGTWMLVQRPTRKYVPKTRQDQNRKQTNMEKAKSNGQASKTGGENAASKKAGENSKAQAQSGGSLTHSQQREQAPSGSRFDVLEVEETMESDEFVMERNNTAVITGEDMEIMENSIRSAVILGEVEGEDNEENLMVDKDKSEEEGNILDQSTDDLGGTNSMELRKVNQGTILYGVGKNKVRKDIIGILEDKISREQTRSTLNFSNDLGLRGGSFGFRNLNKDNSHSTRVRPLSGKENFPPRALNPSSVVNRRQEGVSNHQSVQVLQNERSSNSNHSGSQGAHGVLSSHRVPDGGTNNGYNPSPSGQGLTASEFVSPSGSQSSGDASNSSGTGRDGSTNEGIEDSVHGAASKRS